MKNSICIVLIFLPFTFFNCTNTQLDENAFYVSPKGDDGWSGRLSKPNRDKTDGPFATLERAREIIRSLKKAGQLPQGGITVFIRENSYQITKTFQLTSEASGTENAPIIWRAYPGEKVSFIGGKQISGFEPVSDPSVLKRIDKAYHDKILAVNLVKLGITNFGELKPKGFSFRPHKPLVLELFFKEKAMTLARYPNEDWLKIADVPQSGKKLIHKGNISYKRAGIPAGRHYGRFKYEGERPNRWAEDDDIWMHGYWTWDWADTYEKIQMINKENKEIFPAEPYSNYGYTKGQRYYFINILEELDSPGEYYLDRKTGVLYCWPPAAIEKDDVTVSLLEEPMLSLDETSFVIIQGITFKCSRTTAVGISGGTNNKIAGCVFKNLGNMAVIVDGGTQNGVIGCDIYNVAAGGIQLNGGDRKTLTPADNYAENNHIHHFGRIFRTYSPAISLTGVGNRLSHNYIHDSPHAGILFKGNEHILEFNEIHDIAKETGDVGSIYIGRDWTCRGNIIRHNYFHHLHGPGLHGVRAVYLDDWSSGTVVYGNVFYKAGRAAFIGGGRDNVVENNLFIDCEPSVQVDGRGLSWASFYFDKTKENYTSTLFDRMDAMNFREPPYSAKYPELLTLYEDDPAIPKNNKIIRNVSYGGRFLDLYDGIDFEIVTVKDNLIGDPIILRWTENSDQSYEFRTYEFGHQDTMEKMKGNTFLANKPGFVDLKKENFQLKEDSPAYKLGFERIPIEKIGLYVDKYRKSVKNIVSQIN